MIPIPAIDLKNGKVVRLLQGNFKEEKIYSEKAELVAKQFESDGARRIHVVDLDGALKGIPQNFKAVEAILKNVKVPIQVGGGVRSIETAEQYFSMGVGWVILGTQACLDEGFLKEALKEFREKLIVGIDASHGMVMTQGWTQNTQVKAIDLALGVERLGGKCIIYTDIAKDGALQGPNLKEIKELASKVVIDVIASGGISSLEDLKNIMALKQNNIYGVVIGKAIYEKKFNIKEASDIFFQGHSSC